MFSVVYTLLDKIDELEFFCDKMLVSWELGGGVGAFSCSRFHTHCTLHTAFALGDFSKLSGSTDLRLLSSTKDCAVLHWF